MGTLEMEDEPKLAAFFGHEVGLRFDIVHLGVEKIIFRVVKLNFCCAMLGPHAYTGMHMLTMDIIYEDAKRIG